MTTPTSSEGPSSFSRLIDRVLWLALGGLLVFSLWPRPSGPETGTPAAAIDVELLDSGTRFHSSGRRDKPLLLEAFASWCGACRRNKGLFNSFEGSPLSSSIDTLAISVDSSRAAALRAKNEWPIVGQVAFDDSGRFNKDFSIEVLPTYILIDQEGKVLKTHAGGLQPAQLAAWMDLISDDVSSSNN